MPKDNCLTPALRKKYDIPDGVSSDDAVVLLGDLHAGSKNSVRQAQIQAVVVDRALKEILSYAEKNGKLNAKLGLNAYLATDRFEAATFSGLQSKMIAVNASVHSELAGMMEKFRPTLARTMGINSTYKDQHNFVKALFGEATDAEFSKFAKSWKAVNETLRLRFNRAGGDIKSLDQWNLPQVYSISKIRDAGFDQWHADIIDQIDLNRMYVNNKRMSGMTTEKVKEILRETYSGILTDGVYDAPLTSSLGMSKIANRHQQARFLKYKDADSWLENQKKYSDKDPYEAMMDHVTMIANEIGLMESLGPNADIGFRTLLDGVKKQANMEGIDIDTHNAEDMYANLSGKLRPVNETFAQHASTARSIMVATKLTGASIAASVDVIAGILTSNYNGFGGIKLFKNFLGELATVDKPARRKLAAELMMPLEGMISDVHSSVRFAEIGGNGYATRAAGAVLRASGLDMWTSTGKMAYHFEAMSGLADPLVNNAENLKLMDMFRRYGIDKADQKVISKAKKLERDGVFYLDVKSLDKKLGEKIISMTVSETRRAVPEGDVFVKSVLNQGTKPGSVPGEVLRSATQFKNFPATIIADQYMRTAYGHGLNKGGKLGYGASAIVGTVFLGTMVVQLKEIMNGREPIDWENPRLWTAGFLQGGAGSIMADAIVGDSREFGQSMIEFFGGPLAAQVNKIFWKGVLGNMDDVIAGDKEIVEILKSTGASTAEIAVSPFRIYPARMIIDRYIIDEIKRFGDPNYDKKKRTREKDRIKKYGNEEW